jgi:hypothetical protein
VLGLAKASDTFNWIDLSSKKAHIEKIIYEKFDLKVEFDDLIIFKFFPYPHFNFMFFRLSYEDSIMVDGSKISLDIPIKNIFNIIAGGNPMEGFLVSNEDINISDVIINAEVVQRYVNHRSVGKNKMISPQFNAHINQSNIINIQSNSLLNNDELIIANTEINISDKPHIGLKGYIQNLFSKEIKYELKISNTEKGHDIEFLISDTHSTLNLNLYDLNYEDLTLKGGNIELIIDDLEKSAENLKNNNIQTPNLDKKARQYMILKGDIAPSDGEISLENISFEGSLFENPSLEMKVYMVSDDIIESKIVFSASSLDLGFMKSQNIQKPEILFNNASYILSIPAVSRYLNINSNVNIKKISVVDEIIQDFQLNYYNICGNTVIETLQAVLPGESTFNLYGMISTNGMRKKFDGIIELSSKHADKLIDLYQGSKLLDDTIKDTMDVSAKIMIMNDFIKVYNLRVDTSKTQIIGAISLYNMPYNSPIKNLFIKGRGIDLDATKLTDVFDGYLKKLYLADRDKTGEEYFKITNTDNWIRCFDKYLNMELDFDDVTIRGQKLNNVKAVINIKPSVLNIKKMTFDDPKVSGDFNFKFVLPVMRPQISTKLDLQYLDWDFFKSILTPYYYFHSGDKEMSERVNWFGGNSYDGTLKIDISKLKINDSIVLEDINTLVQLELGSLLIPKLTYKLWNGAVEAKADVIISSYNPLLDMQFNIFNINPKELFKNITGADKIDGYMSFAGELKSYLQNFNDIERITGQIVFEGAQISWYGIGLDDVIKVVDSDYTKDSKLKSIDYYMRYGTTVFDSLKGSMLINKGIINIDNASLVTPRLAGVYSINYNFLDNSANGAGAFAFIPTNGKDTLMIKTKTIGKLPNPDNNTIDYKQVTDFVKKTATN